MPRRGGPPASLARRLRPAPLPDTGAYCKARTRLPEGLLSGMVCETADRLQERAPEGWLLRGRRVVVADGTTVSMPDTPEKQRAYPMHFRQRRGSGSPIARIVVLLSMATGAALDAAMAPWAGKLPGENALLRPMRPRLKHGDILLPTATTAPTRRSRPCWPRASPW